MSDRLVDAQLIVWTDFDGTITLQDSNDCLTDNLGFGRAKRLEQNKLVLEGKMNFRESFYAMMQSVKADWPTCLKFVRNHVELDPGFAEFCRFCRENSIPIVILSSGMEEIIRTLLSDLVGEFADKITVIANSTRFFPDGKWEIVFRDDSSFGHDKSQTIKPIKNLKTRPKMIYIGDGVSDISAAQETDLLLVRAGGDLVKYCTSHEIPFLEIESFHDVVKCVNKLLITCSKTF